MLNDEHDDDGFVQSPLCSSLVGSDIILKLRFIEKQLFDDEKNK